MKLLLLFTLFITSCVTFGAGNSAIIRATAPIDFTSGNISMQKATALVDGYLAAADFAQFQADIADAATAVAPIDSQIPNAAGLALVSGFLSTQTATPTLPGMMSAVAQTFGGDKVFLNGITAPFFQGDNPNTAESGLARMSNNQSIAWRNFAGTADLPLLVNASDQLIYNGMLVPDSADVMLLSGVQAMTGNMDLGTNQIKNVVDPTLAQDAATMNYVDTELSTALSTAILRDGSQPPTATIPWGNQALTSVLSLELNNLTDDVVLEPSNFNGKRSLKIDDTDNPGRFIEILPDYFGRAAIRFGGTSGRGYLYAGNTLIAELDDSTDGISFNPLSAGALNVNFNSSPLINAGSIELDDGGLGPFRIYQNPADYLQFDSTGGGGYLFYTGATEAARIELNRFMLLTPTNSAIEMQNQTVVGTPGYAGNNMIYVEGDRWKQKTFAGVVDTFAFVSEITALSSTYLALDGSNSPSAAISWGNQNLNNVASIEIDDGAGPGQNMFINSPSVGSYIINSDGGASITGTENTVFGRQAGNALTTGVSNTLIGRGAGSLYTGSNAVYLGRDSGSLNVSGANNVYIGKDAGQKNLLGNNTLIGHEAADEATDITNTVTVGFQAGRDLTTGDSNTFVGYAAGLVATTAALNTYIGHGAGLGWTGGNNVAVGANINGANTGNNNTVVGIFAGNTATGMSNSALFGRDAGTDITTGSNNTCLGFNSCDTLTTGSNNISLGKDSAMSSASSANEMIVGSSNSPIGNIYLGEGGRSASVVGAVNLSTSLTTGTNIAGPNLNIIGGRGTGSGSSGVVTINAGTPTGSGTADQGFTQVASFSDSGTNFSLLPITNVASLELDDGGAGPFTIAQDAFRYLNFVSTGGGGYLFKAGAAEIVRMEFIGPGSAQVTILDATDSMFAVANQTSIGSPTYAGTVGIYPEGDRWKQKTFAGVVDTFAHQDEVMLLDGSQAMTGDMDLGTNDILNVNRITMPLAGFVGFELNRSGNEVEFNIDSTFGQYVFAFSDGNKWSITPQGYLDGLDTTDGGFRVRNQTSVATPPAGRVHLYPEGDRWKQKNDSGVVDVFAHTDEVMLLDGSQAMTGALDAGNQNIINAASVRSQTATNLDMYWGTALQLRHQEKLVRMLVGFRHDQAVVSLTADNQVVDIWGKGVHKISSDSATASDRTFTLTGNQNGSEITLLWEGANAGELLDTGNVCIDTDWRPVANESITLIYTNTAACWQEKSRTSSADTGITQLTGDVTAGPGSGSQAATIADEAVTYAKMQHVSTTDTFLGRDTAGAGDVEEISAAAAKTILDLTGTNSGDVTLGAVGASPNANAATLAGQALNLELFDSTNPGVVAASGGGTANFLRADGTWATPPGAAETDPLSIHLNGDNSPSATVSWGGQNLINLGLIEIDGASSDFELTVQAAGGSLQLASTTAAQASVLDYVSSDQDGTDDVGTEYFALGNRGAANYESMFIGWSSGGSHFILDTNKFGTGVDRPLVFNAGGLATEILTSGNWDFNSNQINEVSVLGIDNGVETAEYEFSVNTINHLNITNNFAGNANVIDLETADQDGTDGVGWAAYSVGDREAIDYENFSVYYDSSSVENVIQVDAGGTGVLRPLEFRMGVATGVARILINGNWDFEANLLTDVADPVSAQDAATKNYVDTNDHDAVTLAAVGAVPNANGASLSGQILNLQPFDSSFPGVVTASGGGTVNFLRADGTWAAPPDVDTGITQLTGEVTAGPGSGSQVASIDKTAISNQSLVTADVADHLLIGDASDSDNLKKITIQSIQDDILGAVTTAQTTSGASVLVETFTHNTDFVDDDVFRINSECTGMRTDGAEGIAMEFVRVFKKDGAAATVAIGVGTTKYKHADDNQWGITIVLNGNNVEVRVEGNTGDTANWSCKNNILKRNAS